MQCAAQWNTAMERFRLFFKELFELVKKIDFWTAIRNCYILIISYCKYLSKLCFSLVSYPMWMHSWKRWTMYWKQTSALSFRGWAWTTLIGLSFFVFQSIFWCILSVFLFSCSSLVPDFFFFSNSTKTTKWTNKLGVPSCFSSFHRASPLWMTHRIWWLNRPEVLLRVSGFWTDVFLKSNTKINNSWYVITISAYINEWIFVFSLHSLRFSLCFICYVL